MDLVSGGQFQVRGLAMANERPPAAVRTLLIETKYELAERSRDPPASHVVARQTTSTS